MDNLFIDIYLHFKLLGTYQRIFIMFIVGSFIGLSVGNVLLGLSRLVSRIIVSKEK